VRLATCGLCSWRRKLPHVCFLAVSACMLKVRLDTKAPKKFSYILHLRLRDFTTLLVCMLPYNLLSLSLSCYSLLRKTRDVRCVAFKCVVDLCFRSKFKVQSFFFAVGVFNLSMYAIQMFSFSGLIVCFLTSIRVRD